METRSSNNGGYGNTSVGIHEHGEWEAAGGGQAGGGQEKVLIPCQNKGVKNIKEEEVGGCWV